MSERPVSIDALREPTVATAPSAGWAERLIIQKLCRIGGGRLRIRIADRTYRLGESQAGSDQAEISVDFGDERALRRIVFGGTIGAGEGYMAGEWTCSDLTALIRLLIRSGSALGRLEGGFARLLSPLWRLRHLLRFNSRSGSRRNIAAHYDIGNDFYEQFLDPTLTYSCGVFESPDATMLDASLAKFDRICRRLDLGPDDHLLEIGTGWGGLAIHAARRYGCRVTTTTISPRQFETARDRIDAAGLGGRITLLLKDYRDLSGNYDKLVSVEMIEAIGWRQYHRYFAACARLLRPRGLGVIQAINMAERLYDSARHDVDFIKRHIFPGSCIPSVGAMMRAITQTRDLDLIGYDDLTPHYATTLRCWLQRLLENADELRSRGYPDSLIRMFEFYFCYCEAGFLERNVGVGQLVIARPAWRPAGWR